MLPDDPTMEAVDPAARLRRQALVDEMFAVAHEPRLLVAVDRLRLDRPRHPALLGLVTSSVASLALWTAAVGTLILPQTSSTIASLVAAFQGGGPPLPIAFAVMALALLGVAGGCFGWATTVGARAPLRDDERAVHLDLSRRLLELDRVHDIAFPQEVTPTSAPRRAPFTGPGNARAMG